AHPPREHEEEVAEAVHVLERPGRDGLDAREREPPPLGAAAHRARLMEEAAHAAAAGEDEGLERLEILLAAVHELLERLPLGLPAAGQALLGGVARRGQLAAEVEELVLETAKHFIEPAVVLALLELLGIEDPREPDDGVELVDGAVGLDPERKSVVVGKE